MPSVTFATNCWEIDWNIELKTNFLKNKIERNGYKFERKILVINNVLNRDKVERYAKKALDEGVISEYAFAEDHIDDALKFFNLSKEDFGRCLYFSNHQLVCIYLCKTDYLLYYTADAWLDKVTPWIEPALAQLETNRTYKVANPLWNQKFDEAKTESSSEIADFWVGFGFSDQCFLVRTSDFRAPIYNETNPVSERYPLYAGESFEKRVDSWMRNHKYLRLTYKHGYYIHEDFPKSKIMKKIAMVTGKYDR